MQPTKASQSYRIAAGISLVSALTLVWLSLGVGIIGGDGDPANLMYLGVLGIGVIGAIATRLRPGGLAATLLAMALAQAAVAIGAVLAGLGLPWSGPMEVLSLNAFFVAAFALAAWLFRRAQTLSDNAGGTQPAD